MKCKVCGSESPILVNINVYRENDTLLDAEGACVTCAYGFLMKFYEDVEKRANDVFDNLVSTLGRTRPTWRVVENTKIWELNSRKLTEEEREKIKGKWISLFGG